MSDTLRILIPVAATHLVVLAAILFFIKRHLLGDTMRAVERVKQVEAEVRKKEERMRRQIESHEKEFQQKKVEAEEELQRGREASDREVAVARDKVIGDARKEGEQIVEQARRNEEKLRQQIAQDMEEKSVVYAGEIFKLVFSQQMSEQLNRQFVGELLDALEEVDGGSITVDSHEAQFASSYALEADQKARLESLLKEKFGAEVTVQEEVKEELMAGLVFKLGSLEIDGSLRNRLQEAIDEVKKQARG